METVLTALCELSENKMIVAVTQVLIGAGLLGWWSHRRDQKITRRNQAIKFIEETADLCNATISKLFGLVHNRSLDGLNEFSSLVGRLFEKRLGTRIKSQALLGSRDFSKEYEKIMFHLRDCREALKLFSESQDTTQTIEAIESGAPSKEIPDFTLWADAEGGPPRPWGHFDVWAEWMWSRTDYLLAKALSSAIKNEPMFKLSPYKSN